MSGFWNQRNGQNTSLKRKLVPANTFTIPSQSSGGHAEPGTDGLDLASGHPTAFEALKEIRKVVTALGSQPTTLIVVDDFRFDKFVRKATDNQSDQPQCYESALHSWIDWIFNPAEVEFRLSTATQIMGAKGLNNLNKEKALYHLGVTHGALVLLHTLNLLKEFSVTISPDISSREVHFPETTTDDPVLYTIPLTTPELNSFDFRVIAVDANEFDTETITSGVERAIDLAKQRSSRIVVNMSFGLVPHELLDEFKNLQEVGEIDSYEEYKNFFANNQDPTDEDFHRDLQSILKALDTSDESTDTDPLTKCVRKHIEESAQTSASEEPLFAFIASAGNYGLDFPLYPAAWKDFISVSTSADYSNAGEISALGGFAVSPSTSVNGTSFAAPLVSVLTALDMTRDTPNIQVSQLDRLAPSDWESPVKPRVNVPLIEVVKMKMRDKQEI